MKEETSSANGISVSLNCTSSIPLEPSSVYVPIYPDSDNLLFLGVKPTQVQFEFTPSVITYLDFYITIR